MLERQLSWASGLVLAAVLLAVSLLELLGPAPNPVFGLIASRSGVSIVEPFGRYATVALQLIAVALLLPPRTRMLGAGLAVLIAAGALLMHLTPWLGVYLPDAEQASAALAAGRSAAQIDAMVLPTDKGAMFLLALAIAVLGTATVFLERHARTRSLDGQKDAPVQAANGAAHTRG